MLQLSKKYLELDENGLFAHAGVIYNLFNLVRPILQHRKDLYDRYNRVPNALDGSVIAPFERYITNVAAGYAGGKPPRFTVAEEADKEMKKAVKKMFDKGKDENVDELKVLVDYINDYNDLPLTFYTLIKEYCMMGAAYARLYENDENEIVFAPLSARQTVALYDYSTPAQKIALIRVWDERTIAGNIFHVLELTTTEYRKVFVNGEEKPEDFFEREEDGDTLHWKLCPFMAMEAPDGRSLFEPVIGLIDAYETVLENAKHTFEYNDNNGCKLMIVGYAPQNPLMVEDSSGNLVQNPDRVAEDKLILEAPTFYTDENGKVEWITKNINDTAVENHKKTLLGDIMLFCAIPDISENGVVKTATEVERSFFPLEQYLIEADRIFYKEFVELWENITARINLKKHTNFDFRNIKIDFVRNLPTDKATMVNNAVLLQQLLSRETLIGMLPYDLDVANELAKEPASKSVEVDVENNAIGKNQNENQYNGADVMRKEEKAQLKKVLNETEKSIKLNNERI